MLCRPRAFLSKNPETFTLDVLRNPRSEICCAVATGSNDLASAHIRALPSPGHGQWAKSFPLGQPPRNQQFVPSRLLEHVNSLKPGHRHIITALLSPFPEKLRTFCLRNTQGRSRTLALTLPVISRRNRQLRDNVRSSFVHRHRPPPRTVSLRRYQLQNRLFVIVNYCFRF